MRLPPELRCPRHDGLGLQPVAATDSEHLVCAQGCRFPLIRGIPRFVASDAYAKAFGLQWKAYRRTQLDSYTGTRISRSRLERCLGGSLDVVQGRSVLEAGCGAGRFTEILLAAGARVFAFDLSQAVEANLENCGAGADYFVCQADALQVPAAPLSFDVVVALGMLQHTPSPEATIRSLARHVKPGGLLVLDHYARPRSWGRRLVGQGPVRAALRALLLRLPPEQAFAVTRRLTGVLLPLHRALWRPGGVPRRLRSLLHMVSPVFDYYDAYPELGPHLASWAYLDTHDALTDRYKHLRTERELQGCLQALSFERIETAAAGNGVEARARRCQESMPVGTQEPS